MITGFVRRWRALLLLLLCAEGAVNAAVVNAPSNLVATTNSPFTFSLRWTDNSNNEDQFLIGIRTLPAPINSFSLLGSVGANVTNFVAAGLISPNTTNEIVVQAVGAGANSVFSPSVFVIMPRFDRPTNLRGTAVTPSTVNLSWRDNTTNESLFYVLSGTSPTNLQFFSGSTVSANITNFTVTFLTPGATNFLAVGAYYADAFSTNTVESTNFSIVLPQFRAPTNLIATATNATSVSLRWTDLSTNEASFRVAYRPAGNGQFFLADNGTLPANTTNFTVTGLSPVTSYEFFVEAYIDDNTFSRSSFLSVTTRNGFLSRRFHPAVVDQPFNYTLVASTSGGAPDSYGVVGALPPGLSFVPESQSIEGTPTTGGVYQVQLTASYPGGETITNPFTFRIIYPPGPPVVRAPIPTQTLTKGGSAVNVPLPNVFADLDTERAVRFQTTLGSFNLALYTTATPATVSNFLNYVNRGEYSNTVVHRSAPNFVVQGGSFRPSGTNMVSYPTDPPVINEPGVQHVRGTVSVPKAAGQENSGTAGIFFNLNDNSSQLDDQTGGFAAFGRVTGSGMSVVDAIAALPIGNYNILLDGISRIFDQLPVNAASAPTNYNPTNNVIIQSVSNIPPLQWSVGNPSVTGIVSAAIVGTNLQLTPVTLFGGVTELPVIATDLDGNSTTQLVTVQITSSYTTWLNGFGLAGTNSVPGADTDLDKRENGVEFAFGGNPTTNDAALLRGTNVLVTANSQQFLAMRFRLRKDLSGATAWLQGTPALGTTWTNVWTSADINGPQVLEKLDQGEFWGLLVRDVVPVPVSPTNRFLQLRLQVP